jgi:type II secretory pathway pseudopilin PulG
MNAPALLHGCRRSRRGMVLFEVIIALTIFALIAFSLVTALDSAFDAAEDRNDIDVAVRGLQNQMELLHSARILPGDRDMPDDGSGFLYHVSVTVPQLTDQKNQPIANMLSATITATWKAHGQDQSKSVSELIYQP